MRRLGLSLAGVILALSSLMSLIGAPGASALSGSSFQPGRIIDDQIFYNALSMTPLQIATYLQNALPLDGNGNHTCDTAGNKPYYGTYGGVSYNGNILRKNLDPNFPAPYTCLYQYLEDNNVASSGVLGSGGNNIHNPAWVPPPGDCLVDKDGLNTCSSAYIIFNAAKQYNINPQVLIVLLQKEQNLVQDDWPWYPEYRSATGYGCPDTSACSSTYYGFYNQVHNAAKQFHMYATSPNSFNYTIGSNQILYNPNSACGTQSVNIVDQATASLYNYTPYVPNAAALNNLYGSGDGCSSYGNRNFWRLFNDMFGMSIYTVYGFQSAINPPSLMAYGDTATAQIKLTNDSPNTWYGDGHVPVGSHPYRLMMRGYANNDFADTSDPAWLGTQNQIKMVEASVPPGGTATFSFGIKAPSRTMAEDMNMILVQDGVAVYQDFGLQFHLNAVADYAYQVTSVSAPAAILPGDTYYVSIKATNTGVKTWYSDTNVSAQNPHPIRLATPYYVNSPFAFPRLDPAWLGTQNQIKLVEDSVPPGQTGTFTALFTGPNQQIINYVHNFELVLDGVKFIAGAPVPLTLSTPQPDPSYSFVSATNPPAIMAAGSTATPYIKIRNTGNMIWRNFDYKILNMSGSKVLEGDTRLLTNGPVYRNSLFAPVANGTWLGTQNQIRMVEPVVPPGSIATFHIPLTAPSTVGHFTEYFIFGVDGYAIMRDLGLAYPITVTH
jgi:hypothetical protein